MPTFVGMTDPPGGCDSSTRGALAGFAAAPYLAGMAVFPRPASPRALIQDLRLFLATRQRHQLLIAMLSVAIPGLIVAGFYHDAQVEPPKPEMYFIPSWPATRSDAEIIAQQKIDAVIKARRLEAEARERAQNQAAFKKIQDRLDAWGVK